MGGRITRLWIPIALVLALTGCAEAVARLALDAAYLHETASNYVRENHSFRQFIRAECKASLVREINSLREDGDETKLREVLSAQYPSPVTIEIITQARADPSGILATALGCGRVAQHGGS